MPLITGARTNSEHAYALARYLKDHPDPAVFYWILPEEHESSVSAEVLRLFVGLLGVRREVVLLDAAREESMLDYGRLHRQDPAVYVVAKAEFNNLPMIRSFVRDHELVLQAGERWTPQQIKQHLVRLGYQESREVFGFDNKAGVMTVRPSETVSYRLVFGEERLEQIIDLDGNADQKRITLLPAAFDASYVPATLAERPYGTVICSDQLLPSMEKMEGKRFLQDAIIFETFSDTKASKKIALSLTLQPTHKFQKHFKKLAEKLKEHAQAGQTVVLASVDSDVVKTGLSHAGHDGHGVEFVEQVVPLEGFSDQANKFVCYSHADIFGRGANVRERKRRDDTTFVTTLQTHDYVVHEDHGVARYLGLVTSTIEGHLRENLLLEYAKGDRLYVPVELAYKVDRYVGEAKPALQRLSGTSWIRLTRKATQDSQEFARDLLKLYARRSLVSVQPWHVFPEADKQMHERFGYTETPDQERAIEDVYKDLAKHEPMDRLVVGDVGFGKTEVAIRAAYQAYLNQKQAIVLCPTTLLAQQHYDTFTERLASLGVRVEMLSRFTGKLDKKGTTAKVILEQMKAGKVDVVIGTHRLLSKDVHFQDIGLIIIDEEQRFGVRHKERLKQLRTQAHILTLSATPIPRTLYFSLSGLRDISTITTPPEGRKPIDTLIRPFTEDTVREAIQAELKRGGQVFYLYNHVQTIHTAKKRLQELLGSKVRIDIVHGQMPEDEMARAAEAFDHGKIDVLVCTTIIENGLDIPNVNTLVVENATRFGLGQLYQIRGRIGRGQAKAAAYFLYPTDGLTGIAARRLQILQEAKDLGSGFQLAMRDLEMRGTGQLIGKRQHGHIQSVGLGMYGRLLRQAVEELESGHVQPAVPGVTISLPLDYGMPESLIPDPEQRARFYRQVSQLQSTEEVDALFQPWLSRIAELTEAERLRITNLRHILELRSLAQQTPIRVIDYQETEGIDGISRKTVEFEFREIKPEHVERLIPIIPDFKITGQRIVVKAEDLGGYYEAIKKILSVLANI